MAQKIERKDIDKHLKLKNDELYILLVPENLQDQAYSKEGLIARGKALFLSKLDEVREYICKDYQKKSSRITNLIDVTTIVAISLLEAPQMIGLPVLPMAALIAKMGLDEICKKFKD